MAKILVSTLIYGGVEAHPYTSHCNFWFRVGKCMPEHEIMFFSPERYPIDAARNKSFTQSILSEYDYVFFYDTDMVLDPDVLIKLMKRDKPVIMAYCAVRGYPFRSMIYRYSNKEKTVLDPFEPNEQEWKEGIIKVDALGTACTLIKTDVFKHIPYPYFMNGKYHTEDMYFCILVNQVLQDQFWCDLTVEAGHMTNPILLHSKNRDALKDFYEKGNNSSFYPINKT
jgi:hypothetical protein